MSKELINIISKDDLKTLVNQVYEQKKIYSNAKDFLTTLKLLKNGASRYFSNNQTIGMACLEIVCDIEITSDNIFIDIVCIEPIFGKFDFGKKIKMSNDSMAKEIVDAIFNVLEIINDEQSIFKLVWSE